MTGFQQAADQAVQPVAAPATTFQQEPATLAPNQPTATVVEDGTVVVNGKVYAPQAAATKIEHADQHIKTLEQENAEKDAVNLDLIARIEALEASRKQQDALDKLITEQPQVAPVIAPPEPAPTQEVSKEELVQATLDTIKGEQVAAQQEANLAACIAEAQGAFGDAYGLKVDELAARHNMTVEQAIELAKNQPSVWKTAFIPEKASASPDTTRSTLSNGAVMGGISPPKPHKSIMHMNSKERLAEVNRRMAMLSNPQG